VVGWLDLHSCDPFGNDAPENTPIPILIQFGKEVDAIWCEECDVKQPACKAVAIPLHELPDRGEIVHVKRPEEP
jgi:hypothetical protein